MSHGAPILNSADGTHANGTLNSSGEMGGKCKPSPAVAG